MVADTIPTAAQARCERPAIPDVLEEHLDELGYLSIQRRELLFSPEISLRRLAIHLRRLEAHLDGLRVGGATSVRLASEKAQAKNPWTVYAGARVWLELGRPEVAAVMERLGTVSPKLRGAWKEAFRQAPREVVERMLAHKGELQKLAPGALEIVADGLGWHDLLGARACSELLSHPEPGVRAAVARYGEASGAAGKLLEDKEAPVQRAALWNLVCAKSTVGMARAREMARVTQPDLFAVRVLGLFGERSDARLLLPLLTQKPAATAALEALRDLALSELAEPLLGVLEGVDEELASAAKQVFESLAGPIRPVEGTPAPKGISPARLHWQQVKAKLAPGQRRLYGQPWPWEAAAGEEPMLWVWRRSVAGPVAEAPWLRREVPDGWFSGVTSASALPGE